MTYELLFLRSLAVTIFTEILVALCVIRFLFKDKTTDLSAIIFAGLMVSGLTLPYFWFVLPAFISERIPYLLVGESTIVVIEAVIYPRLLGLNFGKSFLLSLLANLVSVFVGYYIQG